MSPLKNLSTVTFLLAMALLTACGGGGGNPPAPTPSYTITFIAGTGGTITGTATQTLTSGGSASAVTAVPNTGYIFTNWTGSGFTTSTTNPLTVSNVTTNLALTANFSIKIATALAYTDPTGSNYLLKKNTSLSTATHLVLDLVGPAATTGSGISASFTADTTKVAWSNVASTDVSGTYVQNGTAFTLGTGPLILKGKVTNSSLQVVAAQKGTATPVSLNAPLLRLALDLGSGVIPGTITLTSDNTKAQVLDSTGNPSSITVTVGALTAQ
ncbi:MAG: hypothetical protein HGB30_09995 [Holophagaceae bacterium]|nr:hypothetical protein [Holophagaceae bacterium]